MRRTLALLTLAVAAAVAPLASAQAPLPPGVTVVADGLNNPRGLSLAPDGTLYVAEAGRGGTRCDRRGELCFGYTASVTRVARGMQSRIATGLPSLASREGSFASGVHAVSVAPDGALYGVTTGGGIEPPSNVPRSAARRFGRLMRFTGESASVVANLEAFEARRDPDRQGAESNPYGLLAVPGEQIAVDAAGNSLVRVRGRSVSLLAVFPDKRGGDSVPTSVARGPDGAYYVGEFLGGRPRRNNARVFRVVPGRRPTVFAAGFNAITGVAFGRDGSLYVSEFSTDPTAERRPSGDVVRVAPDGTRSRLGVGELYFPAGVAVGSDGSVYVSNWSILPESTPQQGMFRGARGQVLRFAPSP